jgi:hypothetical protein
MVHSRALLGHLGERKCGWVYDPRNYAAAPPRSGAEVEQGPSGGETSPHPTEVDAEGLSAAQGSQLAALLRYHVDVEQRCAALRGKLLAEMAGLLVIDARCEALATDAGAAALLDLIGLKYTDAAKSVVARGPSA